MGKVHNNRPPQRLGKHTTTFNWKPKRLGIFFFCFYLNAREVSDECGETFVVWADGSAPQREPPLEPNEHGLQKDPKFFFSFWKRERERMCPHDFNHKSVKLHASFVCHCHPRFFGWDVIVYSRKGKEEKDNWRNGYIQEKSQFSPCTRNV